MIVENPLPNFFVLMLPEGRNGNSGMWDKY